MLSKTYIKMFGVIFLIIMFAGVFQVPHLFTKEYEIATGNMNECTNIVCSATKMISISTWFLFGSSINTDLPNWFNHLVVWLELISVILILHFIRGVN